MRCVFDESAMNLLKAACLKGDPYGDAVHDNRQKLSATVIHWEQS